MSDFLICLFIPLGILVLCYASIMYEPISYWTHRKGYPTPGWKLLVILPLLVGSLGTIVTLCVGTSSILDDAPEGPVGDPRFFLLLSVLLALCIGGSSLVLRVLPKRKMRISGSGARRPMRILYILLGYVFLLLGVGVVIFAIRYQDALNDVGRIILAIIGLSGSMFYLARRADTPTVEEQLLDDPRPPILYLRSFDQEATHFVEVSPSDAAEYSEVTSMNPMYSSHHLTLEQFLAREIQKRIGPLIALGNPTDYLPPEGAARTYATDGNWQEYFIDLSKRSGAILMQMGNTDNLNWELVSIRERGLQTKLFIVTPPLSSSSLRLSPTGFFIRMQNRVKNIPLATWNKFASILEKAGYRPLAEDPGPGAVVTFDERGQACVLASGAKKPAEYISAICRELADTSE